MLLQNGDKPSVTLWQALVEESQHHFEQIYQRLGVLLKTEDIRSESSYNGSLPGIVKELQSAGLAIESDGAQVIFLEGFVDQNNKPLPFIIQKSDGGYLYATTDLAAVKHRLENLNAAQIIYVIDARQSQHMAMLFAATRKWMTSTAKLEHAAFGSVLGDDRRPFKTRTGETIKLVDLLNEAEQRALTLIKEKQTELTLSEQQKTAAVLSVAAIKYADLSSDRVKDYVFDWSRMLSFEGNSAPYLLNAYVRIQAIFRKGDISIDELKQAKIELQNSSERRLALQLLAFPDVVYQVAKDLAPHYLCHYLCELAASFHSFYEASPILTAETVAIKASRLKLAAITAKILAQSLNLLGIQTLDRM